MKITVLIDGDSKIINLQESIVTTNFEYIFTKRATIFWSYKNVNEELSYWSFEVLRIGAKKKTHTFENGYYSFDDIAKEMNSYEGVTVEKLKHNGHCKITTDPATALTIDNGPLLKLLGFNDGSIPSDTTKMSENPVLINKGLEYIKVKCNVVKTVENINELGKKDSTIVSLPITTTQSLFGSVTEYVDIESRLPIDKGVINQLQFNVTDQDDKPVNIGKVLLECYIV